MLILELLRAEIAERGVQSAGVVDLIDEAWKVGSDVLEGLIGHGIDGLDLQRLHEALGLGVVVRIAAAPHRSDETMLGEGLPVAPGRVLRSAVRVVDTAGQWSSLFNGYAQGGQRQPDVDRAADGVTDDPARPGIENNGDIDEADGDRDIGSLIDRLRLVIL